MSVSQAAQDETLHNMQELQETISRLSSHAGVDTVLILTKKGDLVVGSETEHAKHCQALLQTANRFLEAAFDNNDEVTFLQVRTKQYRELLIAPHEGYALVVLKR